MALQNMAMQYITNKLDKFKISLKILLAKISAF